ncbi:hypothetical protein DPMN_156468 [Dreissena polymorpha]|uniref:Uncharacterized protein n=1 Tax=Dreissena polymorpha TaxID=45954 RepID=A0A9D4FSE5_DREPO|nr:hypothetical protein DPMN_156468 [Dreissena polymorpha]
MYAQLENEVLSAIADKKKVIEEKIKTNNENTCQFLNDIKQQSTYIEQVGKCGTKEHDVLLQRQLEKDSMAAGPEKDHRTRKGRERDPMQRILVERLKKSRGKRRSIHVVTPSYGDDSERLRTEMGPDEVLMASMNASAPVRENFTDMTAAARDACEDELDERDPMQRSLVGQFIDGLIDDTVRNKRSNPSNLAEFKIALKEQNIFKRVNMRKGHGVYGSNDIYPLIGMARTIIRWGALGGHMGVEQATNCC